MNKVPQTTAERLTLALTGLGIGPAAQQLDFMAWMNGLPAGSLTDLHLLSTGECQAVLERLANEREPQRLVGKWEAAREREALVMTPEQVTAWGEELLL